MITSKEMAERYAEAALANYGPDGHLTPAMIFTDERAIMRVSVIPVIADETDGMPGAMRAIGAIFAPLFRARYMTVIAEAWTHSARTLSEAERLVRGELGRRAESGEHVDTAIVVCTYDLVDLDSSHQLLYNVEDKFSHSDSAGVLGGDMANAARHVQMMIALGGIGPAGDPPAQVVQYAADVLAPFIVAVLMPQYGE